MESILKEEMFKLDYESDALTLAKAARIMRCKMFNHDGFQFNGTFPSNCQNASVTSSQGIDIDYIKWFKYCSSKQHGVATTLTISQLIVFNSKKKSSSSSSSRYSLEREPLLPLYIGLSIHAYTRSKKTIN